MKKYENPFFTYIVSFFDRGNWVCLMAICFYFLSDGGLNESEIKNTILITAIISLAYRTYRIYLNQNPKGKWLKYLS